jgi:hypothetical protein
MIDNKLKEQGKQRKKIAFEVYLYFYPFKYKL